MRRLSISTSDIIILCGRLTYGYNGGKLYQSKACADLKHPKAFKRSFISHNAYLMLLGSHILHPFPVFFTKKFSQENMYKPQQTLVNT